jgi:tetratricopeptide (TPR) repeat protein
MPTTSKHNLKQQIIVFLNAGRNKEAATLARTLRDQNPKDYEAHLFLGVALMNAEKYDKARRVLERAVAQFPNQWKLQMILGHVHIHQRDIPHAEEAYRKALHHVHDASSAEIAELHCSLADTLWVQHHRDEAVAEWKEALRTDPACTEAQESLNNYLNDYGEPRAPNPMFDDLYHFKNIHTERYLRLVGRKTLVSKEEAKAVLGVIMAGWNEFVSPQSREMDNWTAKQRSEFFSAITLDFTDIAARWKKEG